MWNSMINIDEEDIYTGKSQGSLTVLFYEQFSIGYVEKDETSAWDGKIKETKGT